MLKTIPELIAEMRPDFRCLTAEFAMIEVQRNNGVVIDVRESAEVAESPTAQSINIPRGMLEMKMLSMYPDADLPIYIHCATGARATLAAEQLRRLGYAQISIITCDLQAVRKHQE